MDVVAALVVIGLGLGVVSASSARTSSGSVSTVYLHGAGGTANPPSLTLDGLAPTSSTDKYSDSGGVQFAGGNVWQAVGTWSAAAPGSAELLSALGDVHAWLGLKNSDDQGTQFDLRAELSVNGALVASGTTRCITGVTRNPSLAEGVTVGFGSFAPVVVNASDVVQLKLSTRIGTNPDGSKCAGHSSATGLRVYYDSTGHSARFGEIVSPLAPAQLAVSPGSFDFGSVFVGSSSPVESFTFSNSGDVASGAVSVALNGSQFQLVSDGCSGTALSGGASCTVSIGFSPTSPGAATGALTLSGSPGGSAVAAVSGTGVSPLQNTSPPTVSGATSVGSTLTANPGSWTGAGSFSYQWQRCGLYSAAVVADQPVGYWRLGEPAGSTIAVDSSGYADDGAYSGTLLALGQPGAIGNSNGEPDTAIKAGTVTVPDAVALDSTGGLTVEAWVSRTGVNPMLPVVVKEGAGGSTTAPQYGLYQAGGGGFVFTVTVLGRQYSVNASTAGYTGPQGPVDGWWHLVGTYDGQTLHLYLNGTLGSSSQTVTLNSVQRGPLSAYPQPLLLGDQFNGLLDEVAVYSSALSQSQVQAHFNAAGTGCSDIAGATGQTYAVAAADLASRLRVDVTATGSSGLLTVSSSDTGYVTNQRPRLGSAPTVSGTTAVGQTLTATTGSWTGASAFAYQWQRCGPYSAAVAADQPVGYWRLGEPVGSSTAVDSSGYADDGAYSGTLLALGQQSAIGNVNGELDTSIRAGTATVADAPALDPTGAVSVEAWVQQASTYATVPVVVKEGAGGSTTAPQYALYQAGPTDFEFTVNVLGRSYTVDATTAGYTGPQGPVDGWWHLVGTYDGQTLHLYLNGTLGSSSQSVTLNSVQRGPISTYPQPLLLGDQFNGLLDEVAVYGTALNQAQVQAHFNAAGIGCSDIAGATSSTYTQTAADVASRLRVDVTAANGAGSTMASSSDTSYVTSQRPQLVSAPTVNGTPLIGSTLTATAGSWTGASAYAYQWQRCSPYSAAVAADKPGAWWRLGEPSGSGTAADSSGYGTVGTYSGNATAGPGALGDWNGEQDDALATGQATVPDSNALNPSGNGWTLEAWVTQGNRLGNLPVIIKGSIDTPEYSLTQNGVYAYTVAITTAVGKVPVTTTASFSTSEYTGVGSPTGFFHLVATYDGSTLKLYANGTLSQRSQTAGVSGGGRIVHLAQPLVLVSPIDDVTIYNTALTQAQVQAHFNAGITFGCANLPGATGPTYAVTRADAGSRLRVVVAATNTVGPNSSDSAESALIGFPFPGAPSQLTYGTDSGEDAVDPSDMVDGVNTATGAYSTSATDASLAGIGVPFSLVRTYTSADQSPGGAFGPGWSYSYSSLAIDSSMGNAVLHSDDGQIVIFNKQPDGSYSSNGTTSSVLTSAGDGYNLTRHDGTVLHFSSAGALTSMRDRNGQGLTLAYGSSPNCLAVTDSAGRTVTFTCNGDGTISKVTLPDGRNVQYGYTSGGLLSSVVDLAGHTWTYQYNSDGLLTQITDPNGHTTVTNTYDGSSGRVVSQADALGKATTFAWDPATETATITDPRGNSSEEVYLNNDLVKSIDELGNTTLYTYDANLNEATVTDPRGNTTTMTFDGHHNMLTRTAPTPLSYQETWAYDALNDVTSHIDGRGNQTLYSYDGNGNLTNKTEPGSVVTQYGRDPGTGLLVSMTDPRGKTTQYAYDSQHNLISTTSPLGEVTAMAYDSSGRMISSVDPRGSQAGANPNDFKTTFAYDALDRKISQTDPLGDQTQWVYDPVGNLLSLTDANNHTTGYSYDADNQLLTVTAPDSTTTTYTYDGNGNRVTRTDANDHVTTYAYDAANRLISVLTPLNATWTYGYDADGNRVQTVSPTGTTTYGYDQLDRETSVAYSDGTPSVAYAYDANGNRTQMTDGAGTQSYGFDALNQLTGVTRGADSFSYTYDPAGDLTQRVYPGGTTTNYTYDDDGRLATVASGSDTFTYGYDAAGNQTQLTRPNGITETRTYDPARRVSEIKDATGGTTLQQLDYAYDPVGDETSLTRLNGSEYYQYDNRDRLTQVCYDATCGQASDTIGWTYDPVGNRLTEVRPSGTTGYSYNAGDELTQTSGPNGTTSYAYDGSGNQLTAGSTSYAYDLANRLISATDGGVTTDYAYDGDGNRLSETTAGTTTDLLWDTNSALPQLALERDSTGNPIRAYIQGLETVSLLEGGNSYYYHHDRLGSITALTSSSGATEWTYTYEPFGSPRSTDQVDPNAPTNPLGYVGQYQDPTTNLIDLRARQYDPGNGDFLSTDPVPSGPSTPYESSYDYAGQDPINNYDLSGMCLYVTKGKCPGQKAVTKTAKKVGSAVSKVVGSIANTVVGTVKQVPNTLNAAANHPGTFAYSAVGYSAGIAFVASGIWLAAEIAGSEAPGLLAQLAHPSDVGFGFLYGATPAVIPGYIGYEGSKKLAGEP